MKKYMTVECNNMELLHPKFFDTLFEAKSYMLKRFCSICIRTYKKYRYNFKIKSQKDFNEVVKELAKSGIRDYENDFTEYEAWAKTYSQHQWRCRIFKVEI